MRADRKYRYIYLKFILTVCTVEMASIVPYQNLLQMKISPDIQHDPTRRFIFLHRVFMNMFVTISPDQGDYRFNELLRIRGGDPKTPTPQTPNSALKRSRRLLGQSPEFKSLSPTNMSARKRKKIQAASPSKISGEDTEHPRPSGNRRQNISGRLVIPAKVFDRIENSLKSGKRASVRQGGRSRMGVVLSDGSLCTTDGRLLVRGDGNDSSSISSELSELSQSDKSANAGAEVSRPDHAAQGKLLSPRLPQAISSSSPEKYPVEHSPGSDRAHLCISPTLGARQVKRRKKEATAASRNEAALDVATPLRDGRSMSLHRSSLDQNQPGASPAPSRRDPATTKIGHEAGAAAVSSSVPASVLAASARAVGDVKDAPGSRVGIAGDGPTATGDKLTCGGATAGRDGAEGPALGTTKSTAQDEDVAEGGDGMPDGGEPKDRGSFPRTAGDADLGAAASRDQPAVDAQLDPAPPRQGAVPGGRGEAEPERARRDKRQEAAGRRPGGLGKGSNTGKGPQDKEAGGRRWRWARRARAPRRRGGRTALRGLRTYSSQAAPALPQPPLGVGTPRGMRASALPGRCPVCGLEWVLVWGYGGAGGGCPPPLATPPPCARCGGRGRDARRPAEGGTGAPPSVPDHMALPSP